MDNKRQISSKEIMDNLVEALYEAATENKETLNEELRRSGYDPDKLRQRGQAFIKRMQGRVRLAQAKQRREQFLRFVPQVKSSLSPDGNPIRQIGTWFKEEFGHNVSNQDLQAFYRKLDTVEEEDMESLAQDAELLQWWENLENESGEGGKAP